MARKKAGKAGDGPGYEEVRSRLEQVVAALERGEGTLEEGLALYEEGVKLVEAAHGILDAAEKRLEVLKPRDDGTFRLEGRAGDLSRAAGGAEAPREDEGGRE